MNRFLNRMAIVALVLAFAAPAMAATRTQKRDGTSGGTPAKKVDRKRDGTGTPAAQSAQQRKQAGGGSGDRKRDNSCK